MFSSSFVISAARVEDRDDRVDEALVERHRGLRACWSDATDDLGRVLRLVRRVARIDALRRERKEQIVPTRRPPDSRMGWMTSSVVPGYVVDSRVTSTPDFRCGATAPAAASMYEVSGALRSSSGVGTQMAIASHSAAREKSRVASMRSDSTRACSRSVGTSGM
jgi:hypothetical protein